MPGQKLAKTKADFAIIQKVIDLKIIPKSNAWELQSLGVVFGDALASTVPGLAWSEVTDEYGTDPPNKSLKVVRCAHWTSPIGACFALYAPVVSAP
jgi:hypothetical protein